MNTRSSVLKLCQKYTPSDTACQMRTLSDEISPETANEEMHTRERIKRFSRWVEQSYLGLSLFPKETTENIFMSKDNKNSPTEKVPNPPTPEPYYSNWQHNAIFKAEWPDGEPVYKVIGSIISNDEIAECYQTNSCTFYQKHNAAGAAKEKKLITHENHHSNHFHVRVKK